MTDLRVLDAETARMVERVCDALVPGSARVRPAVYVDALLARVEEGQRAAALAAIAALADGDLAARAGTPDFLWARALAVEAFYSDFVAPGGRCDRRMAGDRLQHAPRHAPGEGLVLPRHRMSERFDVVVGSGAGGGVAAGELAAPLVLGNTVVLQPSEWSPVVDGLVWGEILAEAGLPAGVLNIVTNAPGEARPIGDELVENPHVRRLNFTGPTGTGRKLAEAAGRQLKRVVLELGGYNPLIVLADADIEYAVNATAFGAFLHQGQICMSARRIMVERSISDEFVSRLDKTNGLKAGDPNEHDTIIGPLINEDALAMITRRVDDAVSAGAKVLAGGGSVGPPYRATLLGDVPADSEFAQVETAPSPRSRSWTAPTRPSSAPTPRPTGSPPGSSRRTSTAASRSRSRSTRGSSTSTISMSATSRRCRSSVSRTAASAASAGARSWTSSPSCAGSPSSADRIRSRSEPAMQPEATRPVAR